MTFDSFLLSVCSFSLLICAFSCLQDGSSLHFVSGLVILHPSVLSCQIFTSEAEAYWLQWAQWAGFPFFLWELRPHHCIHFCPICFLLRKSLLELQGCLHVWFGAFFTDFKNCSLIPDCVTCQVLWVHAAQRWWGTPKHSSSPQYYGHGEKSGAATTAPHQGSYHTVLLVVHGETRSRGK